MNNAFAPEALLADHTPEELGLLRELPGIRGRYNRPDVDQINEVRSALLGIMSNYPAVGGNLIVDAFELLRVLERKQHAKSACAHALNDLIRDKIVAAKQSRLEDGDCNPIEPRGAWDGIQLCISLEDLLKAQTQINPAAGEPEQMIRKMEAAMLEENAVEVIKIAGSAETVDQRIRQIVRVDTRYISFDSNKWAELLDVTPQAVRQTDAWKKMRRGNLK